MGEYLSDIWFENIFSDLSVLFLDDTFDVLKF